VVKIGAEGKAFLYLNADIPPDCHPQDGICPTCKAPDPNGGKTAGVAYSHMIGAGLSHCQECDGDRIAMIARSLEQQGIPLGWGFHAKDSVNIDYLREQYGRPNASLQSDAKEV